MPFTDAQAYQSNGFMIDHTWGNLVSSIFTNRTIKLKHAYGKVGELKKPTSNKWGLGLHRGQIMMDKCGYLFWENHKING